MKRESNSFMLSLQANDDEEVEQGIHSYGTFNGESATRDFLVKGEEVSKFVQTMKMTVHIVPISNTFPTN